MKKAPQREKNGNQLNYSYDKVEELGGRGELGEEG